jgi:hypothetical protein
MHLAPLKPVSDDRILFYLVQQIDSSRSSQKFPMIQKTQSSLVGDDWAALQLTSAAFGATEANSLAACILAQSTAVAQQMRSPLADESRSNIAFW